MVVASKKKKTINNNITNRIKTNFKNPKPTMLKLKNKINKDIHYHGNGLNGIFICVLHPFIFVC